MSASPRLDSTRGRHPKMSAPHVVMHMYGKGRHREMSAPLPGRHPKMSAPLPTYVRTYARRLRLCWSLPRRRREWRRRKRRPRRHVGRTADGERKGRDWAKTHVQGQTFGDKPPTKAPRTCNLTRSRLAFVAPNASRERVKLHVRGGCLLLPLLKPQKTRTLHLQRLVPTIIHTIEKQPTVSMQLALASCPQSPKIPENDIF